MPSDSINPDSSPIPPSGPHEGDLPAFLRRLGQMEADQAVEILADTLTRRTKKLHAGWKHMFQHMEEQDLVQLAFLKIIDLLDSFGGESWEEFYVFSGHVLDNVARAANRSLSAEKRGGGHVTVQSAVYDPAAVADASRDGGTPSRLAMNNEDRLHLYRLINSVLPEGEREVVRLRLLEHDYAAIGAQLNLSETATRQRYCRALGRLQVAWESDHLTA